MSQQDVTAVAADYAKSLRQIYTTVLDATVVTQERNVKFAQSVFERGVEELKAQSDAARDVVENVTKQTEKQRTTVEALARESLDAYMGYLNTAMSFYARGLEATTRTTK